MNEVGLSVTEHMAEYDASCHTQGEASFSSERLLPVGVYPRETSPSTGKKVLMSRSIAHKSLSPAEDRPKLGEPGPGSESTLWLLFSLAAFYRTFVTVVA